MEIMIVLVLIAIVTSIALPRVNISQWKVDGAMRIVQGALQQAERGAIQRQMEVVVSFDATKNRIRVHYDQNQNHVIDAGEETSWYPLQEGNRFAVPSAGVNGSASSYVNGAKVSTSADGYPTVYYHRDGAVSTAFEVYLRSSSNSLNDFRALVVTQATGRVELYRYGTSWFRASM
jgi:Tfp pilus assembly protein FimT